MTVKRIFATVYLKNHYFTISVYFIARRMLPRALCLVSPCNNVGFHVLQTEFAYEEGLVSTVFFRVWSGVPYVDLILAEFDVFDLTCRPRHLACFLDTRFRSCLGRRLYASLPVLFSLLTSLVELSAVLWFWQCQRGVCFLFLEDATIWLGLEFIHLFVVE